MRWMPLRHWFFSYFAGLAAALGTWLPWREFWFSAGAMVAVIVVYVFILSARMRPAGAGAAKANAPNSRQARRAAARRAGKEMKN